MKNETIKCPFCFTQSPHGVRVCKGCHAKIAYGESPLSVAFLFQFVAFGLAWLAFSWTGSTLVSVITFFVSIIILIYKIKKRMQTELFYTVKLISHNRKPKMKVNEPIYKVLFIYYCLPAFWVFNIREPEP